MFLIIALILLLLWIGGLGLAVAGSLIHILLILAIISIVWHFLSGRNRSSI
jgi:uncharacterized membrane protein YtjA (UPF0391 family)